MSKLNPIYLRPGQDPTLQEHQLAAPGCGGFILMGLIILALATDGFAFMLSKRPALAAQDIPTVARIPSSTSTRDQRPILAATARARAYLTSLPPMPSQTFTLTPSQTLTASPGPSQTSSRTPTRTPTATRKPTATRRPAARPRTGSGAGNAPVESQPPASAPDQGQQPMRIITVWAPPIRATCCNQLVPVQTWTPNPMIQPLTPTPTIRPTEVVSQTPISTPTPTIPPSLTAVPTLPAPTTTISPTEPPSQVAPTSTPIPPTATLQPTSTPIPPTLATTS